MGRAIRVWAVLGAFLSLLGACAPTAGDGLPRGWVKPSPDRVLAARHCYRTLARVDCHAEPLAGEAARKVGFFDAPVGS